MDISWTFQEFANKPITCAEPATEKATAWLVSEIINWLLKEDVFSKLKEPLRTILSNKAILFVQSSIDINAWLAFKVATWIKTEFARFQIQIVSASTKKNRSAKFACRATTCRLLQGHVSPTNLIPTVHDWLILLIFTLNFINKKIKPMIFFHFKF